MWDWEDLFETHHATLATTWRHPAYSLSCPYPHRLDWNKIPILQSVKTYSSRYRQVGILKMMLDHILFYPLCRKIYKSVVKRYYNLFLLSRTAFLKVWLNPSLDWFDWKSSRLTWYFMLLVHTTLQLPKKSKFGIPYDYFFGENSCFIFILDVYNYGGIKLEI